MPRTVASPPRLSISSLRSALSWVSMTVVSIVQRAGNTAESAPAGALRLVVIWVVGAALVNAATSGDLACGDLALTGCAALRITKLLSERSRPRCVELWHLGSSQNRSEHHEQG